MQALDAKLELQGKGAQLEGEHKMLKRMLEQEHTLLPYSYTSVLLVQALNS